MDFPPALRGRRHAGVAPRRTLASVGLVLVLGLFAARSHGATSTAAAEPGDPRAELLHWIDAGRARPEAAVTALAPLVPVLAVDPAYEIEALVELGSQCALLADADGVERVIEQLQRRADAASPSDAARARWARLAVDAVRAEQLQRQGPVGRAERLLADALQRLPADLPDRLRLRFLSLHADLLDRATKFEAAVRRFQEAIAIADALPAPVWKRAELRALLAYTLHKAGRSPRALELNQEALALGRSSGDDKVLSTIFRIEGILRSDPALNVGNAAEEQAMRAALDHARRAGSKRDEVRGIANLADLYLRRGDYAQAIAYSERALPLAQALHDAQSESVALANAGLARIMLHQKDEGLKLAHASMSIDERAGDQVSVADTLSELGHYLERAGYLGDAYVAYGAHRRLADQVFRNDLQRNLGELQEAFDHERRRRELDLLEREGRFQQAQLVSRQLQQWLWATGALMGALLLALGGLLLRRLRAGNRQLEQTNAQLAQLSESDVLTGLANRRGFQAAMPSGARIEGTLMLVDIDHFKRINDAWGHAVGDVVLVEVARRLKAALRGDDLVVRWGGEEFLLWLPGLPRGEAETLAARCLSALGSEPVVHGSDRVPVTASIGFAAFPLESAGHAPNWEQAVELVDTAMYLAKAHGRNRAYGVRRAQADSAQALGALARQLETAWREGRVALVALSGPVEQPEAVA